MNYLKPAIAGILFGAVVFFFTFFVLRIVAFVLIISLLFRLFAGRRFRGGWARGGRKFYADGLRNWSHANTGWEWKQNGKTSPTEIKIA